MYSYDGTVWFPATSSVFFTNTTAGGGNGVAYAGSLGRWVVVGRGNCNWLYSNDGINYVGSGTAAPCSASFGNCHAFFTAIYGIAWSRSQSLFIAVGGFATATIVTSTDGITCTARTPATGTATLFGVGYSPTQNRWIVAGTAGTFSLQTSTDNGVTWTGIAGSATIMNPMYGVAWSETLQQWVAVGLKNAGTYIATSSSGTSFTAVTGPNGGNIVNKKGMHAHYGGFIGWGIVGSGTANSLAFSLDGVDFDNGLGLTVFPNIGTGIVYSVEKQFWVAVGDTGIGVSVNGQAWIHVYSNLNNPYVGGATIAIGSFPTYGGVAAAYCNNTLIL